MIDSKISCVRGAIWRVWAAPAPTRTPGQLDAAVSTLISAWIRKLPIDT
jgi:hypothetical protein